MRYLRIINNQIIYPYNLNSLKTEFKNTSFPEKIENTNLEEYSIYLVNEIIKPSDENFTKIINESTPILTNGKYYQNWIVEDAPIEYTESMIQNKIDNKWNQIRSIRNQYLSDCDWTQLSDSPLTTEQKTDWAEYRQELRDVTLQEDPFNIVWPIKPS